MSALPDTKIQKILEPFGTGAKYLSHWKCNFPKVNSKEPWVQTFPFLDFCSGLTLNVPLFFFLPALDKHKFYVYEARLFYVTQGSMFLMFRSIYNPPRSLRTSPLHYFPRRVLSLKILRGRFVSYYGTKSSASRGPNTKEPVYCFNGISFCILDAALAPSRSDKSRGI